MIALLLLAACAPQRQVFHRADDPGVSIGPDTMLAADSTMLPLRSWLPKGKPKAVIVALHGFNDYSNAFLGTGLFFRAHGIALYAYDQRGFGQAPFTGIWANTANLTHDLEQCLREVRRRWPGVPLYVLGESMGGAVVAAAAGEPDFPTVQGIILSAPALWGADTMNLLYRDSLWLAAHTIPTWRVTGSNLKIIASNNIPMLWRLAGDPLVIKKTRFDAIYGLLLLMDTAYNHIPVIKTPTLLMYGGHDQVIPPQPIDKSLTRFTIPVQFAFYPEGYHMLFRDIQGEIVMEDMLSWIAHPDKALPSGFGRKITPSSATK